MPLQATSGTASYDGFGGGVAAVPNYIEDVFSTYLYTGNSPSTQTITNGIDLAGKGGLVWIKSRISGDGSTYNNILMDTARGTGSGNILYGNLTVAAQTAPNAGISSFNSNGFSLRYDDGYGTNYPSGGTFASWTFRKQPKFFDVVTYTGNDVSGRAIAHGLGSIPGCIIVKRTDSAVSWQVYHRSLPTNGANGVYNLVLNTTGGQLDNGQFTAVADATNFYVGPYSGTNASGGTYVAYLFAHNAGGFGLTGTDNVISCGSFTTDGSGNATVNLGYEPQWILLRSTSNAQNWIIGDVMRGWIANSTANMEKGLRANSSGAENGYLDTVAQVTATGFNATSINASDTYIYIAIRRGPMKVPTSGTSVFAPVTYTGTSANRTITSPGFPVDFVESKTRNATYNDGWFDRLRGATIKLSAVSTGAEVTQSDSLTGFDSMTGYSLGADTAGGSVNESPKNYVNWAFRRAPSFFDEVCYTGTGATQTLTHNLQATPELVIIKSRSGAFNWAVLYPPAGYTAGDVNVYLNLNTTGANNGPSTLNGGTAYTSTTFTVSSSNLAGASGQTYVAYLFATCAGVSKVGSYTGNGSTQTINCGFTGGARFVLIKRTDSTGDWYVWDTARGIVSGNDPHLSLNTTAAEVTTDDTIDPDNTGFIVNQLSATNVNVSAATYIYLAIA